jgi:hypothetical protein
MSNVMLNAPTSFDLLIRMFVYLCKLTENTGNTIKTIKRVLSILSVMKEKRVFRLGFPNIR